ncbi:hypothetical protein N7445_005220 [Penicillium cf. griseofulvum]|nr:hypothetical protein N7445_005220 [Penicillium cf. griseofulvum]
MSDALRLTVASLTSSPLSRLRRSTVSDASVSDPDDTDSEAAMSEPEVAVLGGLPGGGAAAGPGEGPAPKSPILAAPAAVLAAPAPPVLPPVGPIMTAAPPAGPAQAAVISGTSDPGPATSLRTPAERDAYSAAQVKSAQMGIDTNGMPLISMLAKDGMDGGFARLDPVRTEIDWRSARPSDKRCAKTGNSIRCLVGQVCGHQAPPGSECDSCAHGNGPFEHCRVVLIPGSEQDSVQWSWACASCNFSAAGSRCSFRPTAAGTSPPPRWLIDLVQTRAPSDPLLKHQKVVAQLGSVAAAPAPSPAAPAKGKARTGKGKGRADKTPAAHAAPTAAPAVPATPPAALKRKAAESGRAGADKKSKYARPPAAKMVAPKYGPAYDSRWYNSPLEVPAIAKLAFEDASVDAYETLKLAHERAAYDLSVMKKVLLEKGLIDDSDAGEGDDGASESSEDPFAAAAKS